MDCACCPCFHRPKKHRYAHILYKTPEVANQQLQVESLETGRLTPDPDKDFNFMQADYSVHPQVGHTHRVISSQPHRRGRRGSTPAIQDTPLDSRPRLRSTQSEQGNFYTKVGLRRSSLQSQSAIEYDDAFSSESSLEGKTSPTEHQDAARSAASSGRRLPKMNRQRTGADSEEIPIVLTTARLSMLKRRSSRSLDSWVPDLPVIEQSGMSSSEEEFLCFLQFSLFYDVHRRILTVHLQEAINLPVTDQQMCDPFVVLHLFPNKEEIFESSIKHKSLNPRWNETFEFVNQTPVDIHQQAMVFKVYNHNRHSRNNFIGTVVVPLVDADLYGLTVKMVIDEEAENFRDQSRGDILISLNYDPGLNIIQGVIVKATNLQKQDLTGLADPYVKVNMMSDGKRLHKWKSSVKRNTLLPVFNDSFQFDISGLDLRKVTLEVKLMDYDRFSRDDHIGTVVLGEGVEEEAGRTHWVQMMGSSNHPVSQWHSVSPPSKATTHLQN